MKKLTILLFLIFVGQELFAQSFYNRRIDRRWIVSAGTGTAKYFGDLANSGEIFQSTRYNLITGLEYRFTSRVSARASFAYFRIHGDDKDANSEGRSDRNLNFVGNNLELSAIGIVQLFEEQGRYYQRPFINANIFAGLALLYFNPRTEIPATDHSGTPLADAGKMTALRQYQTELVSYGPITLAIPFGVGVKMKLSPFFNIAVDGGYRYTFTDYLDDISTVYPGDAAFSSDPVAQALSDRGPEIGLPLKTAGKVRGNPDNKDGYFMINIRAEYYLPPNIFGTNNRGRGPKRPKYKGGKRR